MSEKNRDDKNRWRNVTIQSFENPRTRYNPDKTPGFLPPKTTKNTTEQLCKEEWE